MDWDEDPWDYEGGSWEWRPTFSWGKGKGKHKGKGKGNLSQAWIDEVSRGGALDLKP